MSDDQAAVLQAALEEHEAVCTCFTGDYSRVLCAACMMVGCGDDVLVDPCRVYGVRSKRFEEQELAW